MLKYGLTEDKLAHKIDDDERWECFRRNRNPILLARNREEVDEMATHLHTRKKRILDLEDPLIPEDLLLAP